ncbi:Endonuclease/exonuclease/phosphatase [Cinara cedri]|uniref:Endonuclease/exonuclease/phosphatase n=1 Tax=Cinara cedri TaxID=506608 RepID=A0A5E4MBL0_9HEMI|nr:Endonuclease/exonuclease/phosphatase [Cinara cedri]
MNLTLRIVAWNANGLVQRKQDLDNFLNTENINIALISEIHFTSWTVLKKKNYKIYTTLHPSGRARGDENNDLSVTAIYCPPQGGADETRFTSFFQTLGDARFISGGDYNAKHSHWGSRLITPKNAKIQNLQRQRPPAHLLEGN